MLEMMKKYWMATMAIDETAEEMEQRWDTIEGMLDLISWWQDEVEAGLTVEEATETVRQAEMAKKAREWAFMEDEEDDGVVADTILGWRDGYRCEPEEVPEDIEKWAEEHRDCY